MTPLDIFGMMIFHVTSKVASQRGIKEQYCEKGGVVFLTKYDVDVN